MLKIAVAAGIVGVIAGWLIHQNRKELQTAIRQEMCSYEFPWSGRCSLPNHHAGEHR